MSALRIVRHLDLKKPMLPPRAAARVEARERDASKGLAIWLYKSGWAIVAEADYDTLSIKLHAEHAFFGERSPLHKVAREWEAELRAEDAVNRLNGARLRLDRTMFMSELQGRMDALKRALEEQSRAA